MRRVRISVHLQDGAQYRSDAPRRLFSVLPLALLPGLWREGVATLVPVDSPEDFQSVQRLRRAGVQDVFPMLQAGGNLAIEGAHSYFVLEEGVLQPQDVVAVDLVGRRSEVLMRKSDRHHTIFLTNRCNSRCVMCSQPPTAHDDSWLIQEAMEVARSMTWSPAVFGFTGGEPLLIGTQLRTVLDYFRQWHPHAQLEVLSNGRLASNPLLARTLFEGLSNTRWMIPLYGHAPFLHNHVVQANAFDETIAALLNLQRYKQPIQLRVVLIEPVLRVLQHLCEFIARNLPFVREVALMGCEPIGLALANQDECKLDLNDWRAQLGGAVRALDRGRIPVVLMNLPLCSIDSRLWPLAHQSISDWKNVYVPQCDGCAVKDLCCGLFAWYERGWTPTSIKAIHSSEVSQVSV